MQNLFLKFLYGNCNDNTYTRDVGSLDCNSDNSCENSNITLTRNNAFISCKGVNSCSNLQLICLKGCTVACTGINSCQNQIIYFYSSNFNSNNYICYSQNSCQQSILYSYYTPFKIDSRGEWALAGVQLYLYHNPSAEIVSSNTILFTCKITKNSK